jgi:hypothetical protein
MGNVAAPAGSTSKGLFLEVRHATDDRYGGTAGDSVTLL